MKRGKDGDKIMGPMFPRLHVNDTEKGGPRAPPRNKMALYEQLSVPSQRFNPGIVPVSNPATTNISVPPALSSQQGSIPEKHSVSPLRVTQSAPPHREERFLGCQPEGISLNAPPAPLEQRNKVGDEDDFTVAVFVNSVWGPCSLRTKNGVDKEKQMALKQAFSVQHKNGSSKETAQNSSSGTSLRKDLSRPNEESRHACSRGEHCKSGPDLAARKKVGRASKDENKSDNKDCGKVSSSKVSRLHDMDACLRQEPNSANKGGDNRSINDVESVRCIDIRVFPQHETDACIEEPGSSPYEADNNTERFGDKADGEEQLGNIGKSDDDSETSMVDSVSGLDISPDDVVGIIGQKHFWKARRTIVNQQRVFAVQVFELHRLIKVQKLIAGSPELLLEDSAYLGKASFKTPLAKKFPPEYFVKPLPQIKGGEDSDKPSHLMDWPMENAVGKTSFSSVQNGSQPSGYGSNNGALPSVPVDNDSNTSPWSFHNLPGHRWLIPVMSLSEGLVYKPYPGPGFMGNVCGECGPFGASMAGNYMTPAYGVTASHYQGIGAIPGAPLVGQTYFPPYGMPVTNPAHSGSTVDRIPGLHNSSGQFPGCGVNLNMQHQSSGNLPSQKTVAVQHAKAPASKDTELRGSTASSPSERVQGDAAGNATEGRNALQLFPIAPNVPEGAPQPNDADQPPKVIRVVPHNPRSATASAARIFQSIQEERKHYDSV